MPSPFPPLCPVGSAPGFRAGVLRACARGDRACLDSGLHGVGFALHLGAMARRGVRVRPRMRGPARRKEGH